MSKIYTRTGDSGQTSLVGGQRVSKCSERIESYGTIDELNSHIGLLITFCDDHEDVQFLTATQSVLFVVGSYLATDCDAEQPQEVTPQMVATVEHEIDRFNTLLPPLHSFILPGGTRGAAYAHVCRTICRRAERCIIRLAQSGSPISTHLQSYINRLSDYFFLLARKINAQEGIEEPAPTL